MKWWQRNSPGPSPDFDTSDGMLRITATISSSRVDEYGDRILPTALQSWLRAWNGRALPMLHEHDRTRVAGAWDAFELDEDTDGALLLRASGPVLTDFAAGKECEMLVDRGFINATSIGAFIGDVRRAPGKNVWNIGEIDIREASLVMWPANTDATIDRHSDRADVERAFYAALDRYLEKAA